MLRMCDSQRMTNIQHQLEAMIRHLYCGRCKTKMSEKQSHRRIKRQKTPMRLMQRKTRRKKTKKKRRKKRSRNTKKKNLNSWIFLRQKKQDLVTNSWRSSLGKEQSKHLLDSLELPTISVNLLISIWNQNTSMDIELETARTILDMRGRIQSIMQLVLAQC